MQIVFNFKVMFDIAGAVNKCSCFALDAFTLTKLILYNESMNSKSISMKFM